MFLGKGIEEMGGKLKKQISNLDFFVRRDALK